jgi:hypothetical protein
VRVRLLPGLLCAVMVVLAGCSSGPSPAGPLGNPANWGGGLQCSPGKTLGDGFFELQNSSGETVTVTRVKLTGAGQRKTSPAWLMPVLSHAGTTTVYGLVPPWPPRWPTWKYRKRVPATIRPHEALNLIFAQTRTSDHPRPATVEVWYTAGGSSYTLTEPARMLVSVRGCA